jgi:YggT family protein
MDLLRGLYTYFAHPLLTLLLFVIIAWVIASWLVSFGVINTRNPNVRIVLGFLNSVVDPLCRPIRRFVPPLGGVLDLAPLLLVLAILFTRDYLLEPLKLAAPAGGGA